MTIRASLTIDDIARELSVSKTTVSRAISGKGRISAATRERVQAYIEEHHYRPNAAAKSLAESRTRNLALVLPRELPASDSPTLQRILCAVTDEAFAHNYNVIVCLSASQLLQTLDYRKADGVLLVCADEDDPPAELLARRGVPFEILATSDTDPLRDTCRNFIGSLNETDGSGRPF